MNVPIYVYVYGTLISADTDVSFSADHDGSVLFGVITAPDGANRLGNMIVVAYGDKTKTFTASEAWWSAKNNFDNLVFRPTGSGGAE